MGEREKDGEEREDSIKVTLTPLLCFIFHQVREFTFALIQKLLVKIYSSNFH